MARVIGAILMCSLLGGCLILDAIDSRGVRREPVELDTTSVEVSAIPTLPFARRVSFSSVFGSCGQQAANVEIVMRTPLRADVNVFTEKSDRGVCAGFIMFTRQSLVVPFKFPGSATITLISGDTKFQRGLELKY